MDEAGKSDQSSGEGEGPARAGQLGYVAHEVRNPLSTALWTAELLSRMPPEDRAGARGEKLSGLCLRSIVRVRLLIEDHLLIERLEAGGYPIRTEVVPLADSVAAVVGKLPKTHPAVTVEVAGALQVRADRILLERALDGLIGAASREETPVRLTARAAGAAVEVRCQGARPGDLADPSKGSPSDQRGRSLSLAMARRVAAALGGALTADAEGLNLSIPAA